MTHSDNFTFFVDNVTLEKAGKDKQGNDIMKVGGIATTKAKDTDGEEIDVNGWDVDYFVNSGFFNYNHQAKFNPRAVIGEPTKAEIRPEGVYVEGFLYADSELAKSVYDTTKMLEGSSSNRRMGFSIEGQALERDPLDQKKITKARLTGCALTLNPKNPNTLVNIVKGEYHTDDFVYDYDDVPEEVKTNLEKSEDYIIHLERDGKIVQVDKDLNIKITEKTGTKDIKKSLSTVSGAAMTVESVDQDVKSSERLPEVKKYLSKGEVYSEIFNYIYDVDLEKADMMYKLIEATATKRIQMKTKQENVTTPEITKDDIQKSLDIVLGASSDNLEKGDYSAEMKRADSFKGEKSDMEKGDHNASRSNVQKAEGEDDDEKSDMEKAMDKDEEYQKLKKAHDESGKDMEDYKSKIEKGEVSGYPATTAAKEETMQSDPNAASMGKEGEFMSKGDMGELVKGLETTLNASIEKGLGGAVDLIKSLAIATQGVLNANNDLEKSLDGEVQRNDDLKKSLDDTIERLVKVENTEIPSRTITSQNYKTHPTLEKSVDGAGGMQLHPVNDKQQILDILDRKADLDGDKPNMAYAQSMMAFESSNVIDKSIVVDLMKSENIEIIGY